MKLLLWLFVLLLMVKPAFAEDMQVWDITTSDGHLLTQLTLEPSCGDEYISADNQRYQIVEIQDHIAYAEGIGAISLPTLEWLHATDDAASVMAVNHRIGIYCTHSDESYEPSDGYYSTRERGSIYQIAQKLAAALHSRGVDAAVAEQLHHPHDAGAYRRSRQTAVQLIKTTMPDCLIDLHRDGIPDPAAYAVTIDGKNVSKIRLLVGRGNQNAEVNKEFALLIKAVADQLYPGLIKDIYMGKGTFNQDLLPHSILLECGTYTLEKEQVLASMPMMAEVFDIALYGGVSGSIQHTSRVNASGSASDSSPATVDAPATQSSSGTGDGLGFLTALLGIGIVGITILSAGSWKSGTRKAARHLSEMTGGMIGKKPSKDEDLHHS